MTLIEQNEMIARFMGEDKLTRVQGDKIVPYTPSYMIWQTLMPVVEKLDTIDGYTTISIDHDCVFLHRKGGDMLRFKNNECGSKIAAVYKAVCAGVEWIERLDKTAKAL